MRNSEDASQLRISEQDFTTDFGGNYNNYSFLL